MTHLVASTADLLRVLGNENRLLMLLWLLDPRQHFPPQVDGDLVEDGVCVGFITEKIGLSQPTVTKHLQVLTEARLVTSKRVKNWMFYRPDRASIENTYRNLGEILQLVHRQGKRP